MKKIIALLGLMLSAAVAMAQDAQQQRNPDFVKLDGNQDGYLSREEVKPDARAARFFSKADMNKDGRLSEDEWLKARSMADREQAGQYIDDSAVTAQVKSMLLAKLGVPSADISVKTAHGVVQLSGFVDSAALAKQAGQVASRVRGVREVHNDLLVKPKQQ